MLFRSPLFTLLSALEEHLCMIMAPLPTGFLMGVVMKNSGMRSEGKRRVKSWYLCHRLTDPSTKSQLLSGRPHHQPPCLWFSSTVLFPMSLLAWVIIWAPHAVPSLCPLLPGILTAVTNIVFCSTSCSFPTLCPQ